MMMGSWMGSHFTNDDLVKESRLVEDYDIEIAFEGRDRTDVWEFRLTAEPDVPVVLVVEYQRDGFGAARTEDYLALLVSEPFLRVELQVLGRDELAGQAQYQLTPLWALSLLGLWNLNDGSTLVSPSFSYSASDEATIAGGAFFGLGNAEVGVAGELPSEYGAAAATVYLSVSIFF